MENKQTEKEVVKSLGLSGGFKKPSRTVDSDDLSDSETALKKGQETVVIAQSGIVNDNVIEEPKVKSRPNAFGGGENRSTETATKFVGNTSWKIKCEEEEEIVLPTVEEVEAIRKSAYEEGFGAGKESGYNVGYDAGMKKGEQDINATIARLKQVMTALLEPIAQQDEALESTLIDSVVSICHIILKRELKIDSSQIVKIIREALNSFKVGHNNIKIHLHPRDAQLIKERLSEFGDYSEHWRLIEHATLSPGGCIVESESSLLNASLDQRVSQIVKQIYDQEILRLPGHADEIIDKEVQFTSSTFSDVAEEINQEEHHSDKKSEEKIDDRQQTEDD